MSCLALNTQYFGKAAFAGIFSSVQSSSCCYCKYVVMNSNCWKLQYFCQEEDFVSFDLNGQYDELLMDVSSTNQFKESR